MKLSRFWSKNSWQKCHGRPLELSFSTVVFFCPSSFELSLRGEGMFLAPFFHPGSARRCRARRKRSGCLFFLNFGGILFFAGWEVWSTLALFWAWHPFGQVADTPREDQAPRLHRGVLGKDLCPSLTPHDVLSPPFLVCLWCDVPRKGGGGIKIDWRRRRESKEVKWGALIVFLREVLCVCLGDAFGGIIARGLLFLSARVWICERVGEGWEELVVRREVQGGWMRDFLRNQRRSTQRTSLHLNGSDFDHQVWCRDGRGFVRWR